MEHAATGTCRAHYCFRCACYALVVRASCLVVRTTQVLVARALSCFPQMLSQTLTQFSPTQPLWPTPQSPLGGASQQLSPMLFPGGSPILGSPVRGSVPVEEYELLFSCWESYGGGHVRTHTPPGATAKTVHHFYFNKDPPSFMNATDAGAMAFKNECASVRSAGASLLRGSAKKGASAARALANGAKVKTTAVKDEEQPQQQQVQQQ